MFSVRVVTLNYYQAPPIDDLDVTFSEFRGTEVKQVPVIRVFGSTPSGQKTCLHIHGVFPYIYVPYDGTQPTDHYLQQLATSLNTALQVGQGKASVTFQHVFKISLVSGIPLYGYHKSERQFLKIYFYNPAIRKRAVELLQNGAVMNKVFQPHESHVPFNLQFLMDYNLYGMNMLNLATVKFRRSEVAGPANSKPASPQPSTSFHVKSPPEDPTPLRRRHSSSGSLSVCMQYWQQDSIPSSQWLPDTVARQSCCELEVDGVAADILNRMDLQDNAETNPGLIGIWEDERQRRQQLNQLDALLPPSSPERGEVPLFDAEENWRSRLQEIVEKQVQELQEMESQVRHNDEEEPMDTESSEEVAASTQQSVPCTPANEVEYHYSQNPADSEPLQSGDVTPVYDEQLVHSILEASQRMPEWQGQDTCDDELANLLVDLAHEEDSQDLALSGRRSTQSSRGLPRPAGIDISDSEDENSPELEALEEKEMSQAWLEDEEDADEDLENGRKEIKIRSGDSSGDVAHLDTSNDTQLDQLLCEIEECGSKGSQKSRGDGVEVIPQLDGSSDVKPKEDEKHQAKSHPAVGCGRLGAKSPRKQDTSAANGRPAGASKIARSPHALVQGPLADYATAIESLVGESPEKKPGRRKAQRKAPQRPSSPTRSKSPRTTVNGRHKKRTPTRTGTRSRQSRKNPVKRLLLDNPKPLGARKQMTDTPLVSLGRGRMGNKSPRRSVTDITEVPFSSERISRSPQKPVQGLEKFSTAIEYNIAPCFQYAESLKPKNRNLCGPIKSLDVRQAKGRKATNGRKKTATHTSPSPKKNNREKSDSANLRVRRNSVRSGNDNRGQASTKKLQPSEEDVPDVIPSSPRLAHRMSSEKPQRPSSRSLSSNESPRLQRNKRSSVMKSLSSQASENEGSSDDDFKVKRPFSSLRTPGQASKASAKKSSQAGKTDRKMARGKRSRNIYCKSTELESAIDDSSMSPKGSKSQRAGIGRGGKKSPRSLKKNDVDSPFISDSIIRSPHKPMQGPISVYSQSIGYKIAPLFQYAEAVKPKPKVLLVPLDLNSQSLSKSPKLLRRSNSVAGTGPDISPKNPAKVVRHGSVPVGKSQVDAGNSNQTLAPMSRSPRRLSKSDNQNKSKAAGQRVKQLSVSQNPKASTSKIQKDMKTNSRNPMKSHNEQSPSPEFELSFVFDGRSTSPATVGRGHMGSRSPKDLKKCSDMAYTELSSKKIARTPLNPVRQLSGSFENDDDKAFKSHNKHLKVGKAKATGQRKKQGAFPEYGRKISKEKKSGQETLGSKNRKKVTAQPGTSREDKDDKGSKGKKRADEKPVKRGRKPSALKFDPVTMPSIKMRAQTWPKLKACKELNPQLILRKLCLDEQSWGEVVRNALFRDLDRQVKRKRSEGDTGQRDAKRVRNSLTPPGGKGLTRLSPRKERLKAIMAAKDGKEICKKLKGAAERRRMPTKIVDVFGGGPENKTWNYVPPITPPEEEVSKNPIPEISEGSVDDTRDVMWRLACYSPQRPEEVSSPPRCWSPLSKISDQEELYDDEEEEKEEDDLSNEEDELHEEEKKEEVALAVPISDNEMDIIERNLGEISDFSVYEKMLSGTDDVKVQEEPEPKSSHDEFALGPFQDDVSGIDNHLHGDSVKDALSDEFAKLDKTVGAQRNNSHVQRPCADNSLPQPPVHTMDQKDWKEGLEPIVAIPGTSQACQDGHGCGLVLKGSSFSGVQAMIESSPLLPQQNVLPLVRSLSNTNSLGSNSNSASQVTAGQKPPAYHPEMSNSESSTYTSHSPQQCHRSTSQSSSSSGQFPSQSQGVGTVLPGSQEPTSIPETDSEHSSTCSPPQQQHSASQSQIITTKHPAAPPMTPHSESAFFQGASHASQSMYEMSNHSYNQSSAYGGANRTAQSQGFNQSHLPPPYPSPNGNQQGGFPPPYPSHQPSYQQPHPSPNHHHHQPPPNVPVSSSQPYRHLYPHTRQHQTSTHPYQDNGCSGGSVGISPAVKPKIWRPVAMPPTDSMVRSSLQEYGLPEVHHQPAYWGNPQDHGRQREGLGQTHVQSMVPSALPPADTPCGTMGLAHWQAVVQSHGESAPPQGYSTVNQEYNRDAVWMPSKYPPPRETVSTWLSNKQPGEHRPGFGQDNSTSPQHYPRSQQVDRPPNHSPGRSMPLLPQHPNGNSPSLSASPYLPLQEHQNLAETAGSNGDRGSQVPTSGQHSPAHPQMNSSCQPGGYYPHQPLVGQQYASSHHHHHGRQQQQPTPTTPTTHLQYVTNQHQPFPSPPPSVRGGAQDSTGSNPQGHHSSEPQESAGGQQHSTTTSVPASNMIAANTNNNCATTLAAGRTSVPPTPMQGFTTPHSEPLGSPHGYAAAPFSSTPLRPLPRTSVLNQGEPGVTPIASQKPKPLVDLTRTKNPAPACTPAQGSADTPPVRKRGSLISQIEGPTPKNPYGFKVSQGNVQDAKALHVVQHLTTLSLELHVRTRRDYHPDPDFDPIRAIFYCLHKDGPTPSDQRDPSPTKKQRHSKRNKTSNDVEMCDDNPDDAAEGHSQVGMIVVDLSSGQSTVNKEGAVGHVTDLTVATQRDWLARSGVTGLDITYARDEKDMFQEFVKLIRKHNPDVLAGFEVQQHSWGYLFQRAAFLEVPLCQQISRLPDDKRESHFAADKDAYGADHMSEITVAGRIVLNLWRILRHEVTLNVYTFENVAYHVLHQRFPLFTFRTLTDWFDHNTACYRWRTVDYYAKRVRGNVRLIQQLDLIGRTSELARLFGIEFYSVLSRGSQYRVESMMLRQAKCANYIAISPSVQQRARSKAPECIPLVMEPESRFYEDPVIVLDFQSLYPSMMIAYNYCFSTCLGRVEHIAQGGPFPLGCHSLSLSPRQLQQLLDSDGVHISPNGVAYVKHKVRKGVIPRMLDQILNTRIMVKKALKDHKGDKILERMLDNRQLGLKLIANVTYGYTSANFSGRMPCIEVGDSVVRKGRETLERAIKMVETTAKWGARVVYGDTDSLFVMVKGATKARAFEIGKEIRDAVTAENPKPVKLKLEKVYKPCVLQAKKRYVGYKYEFPDQKEPEFDAKGIETVRRDSCPAVAKILERSLKILFETHNVSKVKHYAQQQFQKLNAGRIGLQDLIFAKEYRGRQYYKERACVPALEIAKRKLSVDRRAEPRVSERVPYVVVHGSPGLPLIQLVRTPQEYLADPSLNLNAPYYVTRQIIPALNRVFGMMGVDTLEWWQELPKVVHLNTAPSRARGTANNRKGTISQYFCSLNCAVCDRLTQSGLCEVCRSNPQATMTSLMKRVQQWDKARVQISKICTSCCSFSDSSQPCATMDCPIRFQLVKADHKMDTVDHFVSLVGSLGPTQDDL